MMILLIGFFFLEYEQLLDGDTEELRRLVSESKGCVVFSVFQ